MGAAMRSDREELAVENGDFEALRKDAETATTAAKIALNAASEQVEPELVAIGHECQALMEIAKDGLPEKPTHRQAVGEAIQRIAVRIAIHATEIKHTIGVDNADSDQAQAPGEVQAGETSAQAGTDEQG